MKNIGQEKLRSLLLAFPQLPEQRRISSALHVLSTRVEAEAAALGKLSGLKAGIMDDLLTGRVRVPMIERAVP